MVAGKNPALRACSQKTTSYQFELEIVPFFPGQELDTQKSTKVIYWEGSVQVRGSYGMKAVQGLGYVEMTGYAGKLRT